MSGKSAERKLNLPWKSFSKNRSFGVEVKLKFRHSLIKLTYNIGCNKRKWKNVNVFLEKLGFKLDWIVVMANKLDMIIAWSYHSSISWIYETFPNCDQKNYGSNAGPSWWDLLYQQLILPFCWHYFAGESWRRQQIQTWHHSLAKFNSFRWYALFFKIQYLNSQNYFSYTTTTVGKKALRTTICI